MNASFPGVDLCFAMAFTLTEALWTVNRFAVFR